MKETKPRNTRRIFFYVGFVFFVLVCCSSQTLIFSFFQASGPVRKPFESIHGIIFAVQDESRFEIWKEKLNTKGSRINFSQRIKNETTNSSSYTFAAQTLQHLPVSVSLESAKRSISTESGSTSPESNTDWLQRDLDAYQKSIDFRPKWPSSLTKPKIKVYVYLEQELNWIKLFAKEDCINTPVMDHWLHKHSVDLHFARAVTSKEFLDSDWYTSDPFKADILVVPILLNYVSTLTVRNNGQVFRCGKPKKSHKFWLRKASHSLISSNHYNQTAHKHFFVCDSFNCHRNFFETTGSIVSKGIVATFENENKAKARCHVTAPYLSTCWGDDFLKTLSKIEYKMNSLKSSYSYFNYTLAIASDSQFFGENQSMSLYESWFQYPKFSDRPRKFSFMGQIGRKKNYQSRRDVCDEFKFVDWMKVVDSKSTCCDISWQNNYYGDQVCNQTHDTKCACKKSVKRFCANAAESKMLLYLRGDTHTSRRAYDAMRVGTIIGRPYDPNLHVNKILSTMPENVPWEKIMLFGVPGRKKKYISHLEKIHQTPEDELQYRRNLMLQYSAVTDFYAYGGLPASEFLIMNAFQKCIAG